MRWLGQAASSAVPPVGPPASAHRPHARLERAPTQPGLFDIPGAIARTFDTPGFAGMTFYEINAKSLLNRVGSGSRVPFEWTVNPYRGCSHACVYCLGGDTQILLADGHTRPLAEIRVGDKIYGTVRFGSRRRYAVTEVLDHWVSYKPAHRLTLTDGTELVASGDHRFLTTRGWRHVAEGDRLAGFGLTPPTGPLEGEYVATSGNLDVKRIEPVQQKVNLFDITTGTGDFIANGVVSHNCFARNTHTYLDLDAGRDFDTKVIVKVNAGAVLRRELAAPRWSGAPIAMGTNVDCYQRAEGRYRLMRDILAALRDFANPFSILTKGTLILRDLDLLRQAAEVTTVRLAVSIGFVDEALWRSVEPGTPSPKRRLDIVRQLSDAGFEVNVLMAPILPALTDTEESIDQTVSAIARAGAAGVTPLPLHLRTGAKEWYASWLAREHPHLLPRYRQLYGARAYLSQEQQRVIAARVRSAARRCGLAPSSASFRAEDVTS
jgi:DNA repair photolyase